MATLRVRQATAVDIANTLADIIDMDIEYGDESGVWESIIEVVNGKHPNHCGREDCKIQLDGTLLYLEKIEAWELCDRLIKNHSRWFSKN